MTQTRRKLSAQEKVALLRRHFKEFVRIAGMTHVRISPGYPQAGLTIRRRKPIIGTGRARRTRSGAADG